MSLHKPTHPGEILKELLIEPLDLTITDVSEHLNGRGAITPEMALRLELVFKKASADHWLKLQNSFDLWQARQNKSQLHVQPYKTEHVQHI